MQLTKTQIQNFWTKVKKTNSCWLWQANTVNGYGRVNLNNKVYLAHRVSAFLSGKISKLSKDSIGARGIIIMHTCDNRICVNPAHLIATTQKENVLDAKRKGRRIDVSGENNPNSKLNWDAVKSIRDGMTVSNFKKLFPELNESQFYLIKNNKSWIIA